MVTFTAIRDIRREASIVREVSSFGDVMTRHYPDYLGGAVWRAVGYINLKLMGEVLAIDIDSSGIIM